MKHTRRSRTTRPSTTSTGGARPRRLTQERGITLVEAAFVTPVFVMLIMALAEAGLFMKNYLAVSNAVRAGARAASAGETAVSGVGHEQVSSDLYTVLAVSRESTAIPRSAIKFVVVYKAAGYGDRLEEDGVPNQCRQGLPVAGQCNVYTVADFQRAEVELAERTRHQEALQTDPSDSLDMSLMTFGCGPSSPDRFWCPNDRVDTLSGNSGMGPDHVGVYMEIDHDWLTDIFGSSKTISDQSVIRIEAKSR